MTDISNSDDIIDSRDVMARILELEEMEAEEAEYRESIEAKIEAGEPFEDSTFELFDEDDAEELRILRELAEQGGGYAPDWIYGETMIRDSYFEEYAQELAWDVIPGLDEMSWPLNRIDWEAAADDLKVDYTAISFDGVTYWIR